MAQTSLSTSQGQLAAKTQEYEEAVQFALEFKKRLNDARRKLSTREAELLAALKQVEELSQARPRRQAVPQTSVSPSGSHDAELRQQRWEMAAQAAEIQSLNEQIAQAQSDQEELKQRRGEVARLATAADASRQQLLALASERDELRGECTSLTQQVALLAQKLRRHEEGAWQAVASGVVGVAAEVAHAYAEAEGLKLPPLTTPGMKPAPQAPPPPPPAPTPPPEDAETKRWREVIAEQKRRGWDPRGDLLVACKLDEIKEEDELARAQEKACVPVTVRKLLPTMDTNFLSQRAALEARVEHHRAHGNAKSFFDRAKWEKEHYRLDVLTEGRLQGASMARSSELREELNELRRRRR